MSSFSVVFGGLIVLAASVAILYFNEVSFNISNMAKTATEISSVAVSGDSSLNGKLVSIAGIVNSNGSIGDGLFLNPGNYIAVKRKVEMYSWVDKTFTTTTKNTNGSSVRKTSHDYVEDWNEFPTDGLDFPDGRQNPQEYLDNYNAYAPNPPIYSTNPTIGVYSFDPENVDLPDLSEVKLGVQNTTLSQGASLANENYLFIPINKSGSISSPSLGDLRISYYVLNSGFNGTIFGALDGGNIKPYFDKDGNKLYNLFSGTREQAISALHSGYESHLWVVRGVGFLLMWISFMILFGITISILNIYPIKGLLIVLVTFPAALVFTIVAILVSADCNVIDLVGTFVLALIIIVALLIFFGKRNKKSDSITTSPPSMTTPSVQ
jgi:uncharacterized protein (UPF0333 family)